MRRRFPRWLMTGAVAGALGAILASALPAAQTGRDRFVQGPLLALVAERLELSSAQKDEARAVVGARRGELEAAVAGWVAARRELFAAIHAERLDEAAVVAASAAVAERELELALLRGRLVQELRPLLAPAQREELARLRAEGETLVDALLRRARQRWAELLAG